MVRPYRREKVASVIRQVLGDAILHRMHDPRIEPLTAVTRVEMSLDLLVARVFLTIPGDAGDETRTLQAIRHAGGFLQRRVGAELTLRNCPELRFDIDQNSKATSHTLELLALNRLADPELLEEKRTEPAEVPEETSASEANAPTTHAPETSSESTSNNDLENGL